MTYCRTRRLGRKIQKAGALLASQQINLLWELCSSLLRSSALSPNAHPWLHKWKRAPRGTGSPQSAKITSSAGSLQLPFRRFQPRAVGIAPPIAQLRRLHTSDPTWPLPEPAAPGCERSFWADVPVESRFSTNLVYQPARRRMARMPRVGTIAYFQHWVHGNNEPSKPLRRWAGREFSRDAGRQ